MKVQSISVQKIDELFAYNWVNVPFWAQRALSDHTLRKYEADMKAGKWILGEGQIVIGTRPNGCQVLISGNHRLTALWNVAQERPGFTIDSAVSFIQFDSDREIEEFYAAGTNKGRSMSLGASLQVVGTGDAIGLPSKYVRTFAAAIANIANEFTGRQNYSDAAALVKSPMITDEVMRNLGGPIYGFYKAQDGSGREMRSRLLRMSVVAVGIVTFKYEPVKALAFWESVAGNNGLKKGEPAHTLLQFLTDIPVVGRYDAYDYACVISSLWNSFYNDEERHLIRPAAGRTEKGIIIKGTPFKGKGDVKVLEVLGLAEAKK